ncbi:hypothetical protein C2845_PM01G03830 [Panicum miliaceum]|uniref:Uncharacterized protein n=1 Tax=Panicum miliaceum TaxID=4540 RepID=A0A3L6TVK3_PANMI|nr:hypothetical protein C2845_PM01G03830 [Panicum miliaceum]
MKLLRPTPTRARSRRRSRRGFADGVPEALRPLSLLVLVLVLFLVTAGPGIAIAFKLGPGGTSGHFPPLLDCAPAFSRNDDDSAFRANVLSLLAALPSSSAAASTVFAATRFLRSRSIAHGLRRHARGTAAETRLCARALLRPRRWARLPFLLPRRLPGMEADSGRAADWRAGCFLLYAETNVSSAREGASFRYWFYVDDDGGDDGSTATLRSSPGALTTRRACCRRWCWCRGAISPESTPRAGTPW